MSPETVEATDQPLGVENHSILMVATLAEDGATSETASRRAMPPSMETEGPRAPLSAAGLSQKGAEESGESPVKD